MTDYVRVPLAKLEAHPKNPRTSLKDIGTLAESIVKDGLISPLVVIPSPTSKGRYRILCGHRRAEALRVAKYRDVLAEVREASLSERAQLELMMAENVQRDQLSVTETARGVQTLLEFEDFDVAAYAKAQKTTQKALRAQAKLAEASPELAVKLDAHQMSADDYEALQSFADDAETYERLASKAGTGDWQYAIRNALRIRELPAKLAVINAGLEGLKAKQLPPSERYTGKYNGVRPKSADQSVDELSFAEHAEAGHLYFIDESWGRIEWYEKRPAAPKAEKPAPTEAEVASARRLGEITAGLRIAAEVRAEHLTKSIESSSVYVAENALTDLAIYLANGYQGIDHRKIKELAGLPVESSDEEVVARFNELDTRRIALILHAAALTREEQLKRPSGWDAGLSWEFKPNMRWLEALKTIHGYELSDIEKEALKHFEELNAAEETDDVEEDEDESEDDEL